MSQENVEIVRAAIEQWNRGEMDAVAFHPDVEWLPLRSATEGTYRGIAGIERFRADTEQTFGKFELRFELVDLGDQVLAWGTIEVQAAQSGIEMSIPTGGLVELRNGLIVRWEDFGSRENALQAAGLAE
ncbi:MAG TPA: nuclear transport factor 2 family protein [Solirubrobacteraceae bacterium]|nr:nuclear transport factor 2 family protein [Solirubrobacteraceae bacterium]